jgi:leucyl-tRNA synthetase
VNPADVSVEKDSKGKIISAKRASDGAPVVYDGIGTMSKSKNNGVDPQSLIDQYGADTARFYTMFASPPTNTLEWSDESVEGSFRFLKRVWSYCLKFEAAGAGADGAATKAARHEIHSVLRQINYDIEKHQLNTVASGAMKILNALEKLEGRPEAAKEGLSILLRVLSPITPHICHALWKELGFGEDIMTAAWPEPDPKALQQDEISYVVQVNGKTRGNVKVPASADAKAIEPMAAESVKKYIEGKAIRKAIVVPGKLINLVV